MTSARIIIKRKTQNIYLWCRYNGSYDFGGRDICYAVSDLLQKYDWSYLQQVIEDLTLENIDEFSCEEKSTGFEFSDLDDFLLGKKKWFMNKSSNIHYEYTIDFYKGCIYGEEIGESRIDLNFDEVKNKSHFMKKILLRDQVLFKTYLNI